MARKSKTESETQYLKGRNKELEKENKSLRRRLKQLERREHQYEDLSDIQDEDEPIISSPDICQDCGKGTLTEVNFGPYDYIICNLCRFRKKK